MSSYILGVSSPVSSLLLALTLVLSGGLAGMLLLLRIGVLPTMRVLPLHVYAETWRALDKFMDRRAPPYKMTLLVVELATAITLNVQHALPLAAFVGVSFLLNLTDLVLTVTKQLPVHKRLRLLPADAPESELLEIRELTVRNLGVRFYLSGGAFVILCFAAALWPLS